ncbi:MAG: hypothetical protein J6K43_06530, partial [Lachnospiraceae bacterium]|nr:hypothetical protein [Lachnospiraceae bacterium]
ATSPSLRFGSVTGIRPMKASWNILLCVQAPNEHVQPAFAWLKAYVQTIIYNKKMLTPLDFGAIIL